MSSETTESSTTAQRVFVGVVAGICLVIGGVGLYLGTQVDGGISSLIGSGVVLLLGLIGIYASITDPSWLNVSTSSPSSTMDQYGEEYDGGGEE